MTAVDGTAVRAAVTAVRDLLGRVPDGTAAVPVMGTSVTAVAQHLVSCLAWYAHDLAAGPDEVSPADLVARPAADLPTVSPSVGAWGEVLARTVDAAGPADRGWHSHGIADAAGFAAIGCAEVLVHGTDVADALGQIPEPGSGALYRICAELQRKHFDPPQLIHVAGAHSKYR